MALFRTFITAEAGAASREVGIVAGLFGLFAVAVMNGIEPTPKGMQHMVDLARSFMASMGAVKFYH